MRSLDSLLAVLMVAAYPVVAAAASADGKLRIAYAEQCRYMVEKDWTSFNNQMAPDFRSHNPDGTVQTRTQNVNDLKKYDRSISLTGCDTEIRSVAVSGKQLRATVLFRTSARILQPLPKSIMGAAVKRGDLIDTRALIVDTWIDSGNGALVLRDSTMKSAQRAINGKAIK